MVKTYEDLPATEVPLHGARIVGIATVSAGSFRVQRRACTENTKPHDR